MPKVTFSAKLGVGASAAIFGTCLIYPLDMMKTQIQTSKGVVRLSGLLDTASAIVAANGPRGLYKGTLQRRRSAKAGFSAYDRRGEGALRGHGFRVSGLQVRLVMWCAIL